MTPLAIHVVIPAHNEAELIGACLSSVRAAITELRVATGLTATITVVADSCTDQTLDVVDPYGVDVLVIEARSVGRARDAGVRHVLAAQNPVEGSQVWIAMTDADSTVPRCWLVEQVRSATGGVGLWIGAAHPDPATVPAPVLRAWEARHHQSQGLHVHGANLGFTAATYLAAGGFPPVTEHEDVAFVEAALRAGSTWAAGGPPVRTSGRTAGRTPGGFAGYLRLLVAELEEA